MTDEEAITRIKYLQKDECDCEECRIDKKAYEIVLNLIEKKDNRINDLEKINDKYLQKLVYALSPTTHTRR